MRRDIKRAPARAANLGVQQAQASAGDPADPLAGADAGARTIRGGALRVAGYGVGVAAYLVTAPFLIRYLGVEGFGGYAAVLAVIGIVALLSDAGLTLVGVREYAGRPREAREHLLSHLLGLRLAIVALGVAAASTFALIAGYPPPLVLGTALAGLGLILLVVMQTANVALSAELHFGRVTALEVTRAVLTATALLALVVVGADVTVLLGVGIPVALIVATTATAWVGRAALRPRFERAAWAHLMREALPVAIASSIGALFYRSALVVMSVTAAPEETGYYGVAYRVFESVIHVPSLLCATAFPVLVSAAAATSDRVAFALQRLADVGLVLGAASGLVLGFTAPIIIDVLAGKAFGPSITVLRLQAAALPATFLVSVWATGLWAVRGQRRLAIANAVGVAVAISLAAVAGPLAGAVGVAATMLVAEYLLAGLYLLALVRTRPDLRLRSHALPKVVAATALAATVALLPVPDLVRAALAVTVFGAVALRSGAVPPEAWRAVLARRSRRTTLPS